MSAYSSDIAIPSSSTPAQNTKTKAETARLNLDSNINTIKGRLTLPLRNVQLSYSEAKLYQQLKA